MSHLIISPLSVIEAKLHMTKVFEDEVYNWSMDRCHRSLPNITCEHEGFRKKFATLDIKGARHLKGSENGTCLRVVGIQAGVNNGIPAHPDTLVME